MILLLLKVTLLFAITLATTATMRRSSAALRHLVCVCGLAGALLLLFTLVTPSRVAVIHADAFGVPATTRAVQAASRRALPVLPWIWLAGAAILLGRMAIGYGRVKMFLRKSGSAGIVFAEVSVPVVTGLFRPVILLPRSAEAWPAERMDAALRHERAHIRRNDLWTLLLAQIACGVYWFHPLVWMVAAQMRMNRNMPATML